MRFRFLLGAALVAAMLGTTGSASAAVHPNTGYTCTGGDWTGDPSTPTFTSIPSGTYSSIRVAGVCNVVTHAVITVTGNIEVAPGALFDAQSAPSTITVGGNVSAGAGSLLGLGCQANTAHAPHPCAIESHGVSAITVGGNINATNAFLVLLNGITVGKNVTLTGGGGGDWAEKNNTVGGNFTISGVTSDWLGLEFNTIGHDANLTNITAVDPGDGGNGAVSVVVNTIGHDLNCSGLGPRLSGGAFPGEVNITGHEATGQCKGLVGGS
jgi:hypothetical protein